MSKEVEVERFKNLYSSFFSPSGARASLHYLYPDDFEYYTFALELVDSDDNLVDFLWFPILPSSLDFSRQHLVNIKKTASAVIDLINPTFNPFPVNFQGNFGRNFKLLIGQKVFEGVAANGEAYKTKNFSAEVKTGYGATKMLERILQSSTALDSNSRPYRLYMYCPAFNANYLVEVINSKFFQNESTNMIWNYSVQFMVLAPANQVKTNFSRSLTKLLAADYGMKLLDNTADFLYEESFRRRSRLIQGL